jgi:SAM-dependent methyltransferase
MSKSVGLEYTKKRTETPFETFLKYTDEKEASSKVLAGLFKQIIKKGKTHFLDIGTGNGEYLKLALEKANLKESIAFVLLEPSEDLVLGLKKNIKDFPKNLTTKIVVDTWEDYECGDQFDVILASHLYHIPSNEYLKQFSKMIKYLKSGGVLIFVLRQIDDPYHFKMKFKPLLFGKDFKAKTLDEALTIFNKISDTVIPFNIKKYKSLSRLTIPYEENMEDTKSIIEFYLNKHWEEIPQDVQVAALDFIKERKGIFKQIDGLAVIKKK